MWYLRLSCMHSAGSSWQKSRMNKEIIQEIEKVQIKGLSPGCTEGKSRVTAELLRSPSLDL